MGWRIGEILIQKKLISWDQLQDALKEQKETQEMTGQILIRKGYVSEGLFFKALADQHQIQFVDLNKTHIDNEVASCIPPSVANKYHILAIEKNLKNIIVATNSPIINFPKEQIRRMTGTEEVVAVLVKPSQLQEFMEKVY